MTDKKSPPCKGCEHHAGGHWHSCMRPGLPLGVFYRHETGEEIAHAYPKCSKEREDEGRCGPGGKYFEPRKEQP